MSSDLGYLNLKTPIVQKDGTPTKTFWAWVNDNIIGRLQGAAYAVPAGVVALTAQVAAIGATAIVAATSVPRYRLSYVLGITRAAGTSESLTLTVRWTWNGVSHSISGSAITGNTTTTVQMNTWLLHVDGGTVITYEVAYTSVDPPDVKFDLDVLAEATA